jgi:DNA polymerase-3 subunit beta
MDPEEFPSVHSHSTDAYPACKFQIQNDVLRSAIRQVCVAASTSDSRPVLTGVSFEFTGEQFHLMATDGIRFASRTLHTGYNINIGTNVIVPAKNINEIVKMLSGEKAATEIAVSRHQISFTANELHVQSVLIEGAFPSAVKNVIPQSCKSELLIDSAAFLHAVERVSVLAGGSIIRLTAASGKLILVSATADVGEVRDEISLEAMEGEDFTIALNARFLLDILRCLDSGSLRVRYTGKESPVVILTADPLSPALFLITPVRTHD